MIGRSEDDLLGADPDWRLAPATSLVWRCLDDEWVVYDRGSGRTHVLAPLTAALLGLVEAGPQAESRLAATVAEQLGQDVDAGLHQALRETLQQLQTAGLIDTSAT